MKARIYIGMMLVLMALVGMTGCSSDPTELDKALDNYCLEGEVAKELTDDRICVRIEEVPVEALSDFSYCFIAFKKSDLPNTELKKGDKISFKITKYEKAYDDNEEMTFPDWGIFVRYNCTVEPCK